jgi:hypothetical protein
LRARVLLQPSRRQAPGAQKATTRRGFEPRRAKPIDLAGQRLNHSAILSACRLRTAKLPFNTGRAVAVLSSALMSTECVLVLSLRGEYNNNNNNNKKKTKKSDLGGNRTPNLWVWNPTRCHCATKSARGGEGQGCTHGHTTLSSNIANEPAAHSLAGLSAGGLDQAITF